MKCDGTRWRTGGEVKGKPANGVGSQYPSHYLGTWCIQHYYRWCAQLGLPVVDWTDAPRWFKWTRPFRRKTKSGFCAWTMTFQTQSTYFSLNSLHGLWALSEFSSQHPLSPVPRPCVLPQVKTNFLLHSNQRAKVCFIRVLYWPRFAGRKNRIWRAGRADVWGNWGVVP